MKIFKPRLVGAAALITALAALGPFQQAFAAQAIPVSDMPLFTTGGQPPLMMMVMSRDEQLFIKAYDDYSDLDGDGQLDTTYQDKFNYSGYFDPHLCYSYSSSQFSAAAPATGANGHQCSGKYSGNFMNWVAMSRMDEVAFVLDGGRRMTPEPTNGAVLERAPIPADLHAWVKVYSGSDIGQYTPYSSAPVTFCNATMGAPATAPSIRTAQGSFPEWAATAGQMCHWREEAYSAGAGSCSGAPGDNSCYDDPPQSVALNTTSGLIARVQVCANGSASLRENFCQAYTNSAGATVYRPVGLLQQYGENGSLRFGLLTGSFSKPRSGGVLRRNIGLFTGNSGAQDAEGCAADDEVNLSNGKFCTHSSSGNKGIVSTIAALDISSFYDYTNHVWSDCNTYGILNRQGYSSYNLNNPGTAAKGQNCAAWGNPLSEMYAEALRYISTPTPTASTPTSAFTGGTDLTGLPAPAWKDPYRSVSSGGNPYCANCSILIFSTGLNSFDSDEIPTVSVLARQAAASTKAVGVAENVSGNYLIGRNATGTPGDLAVGNSVATHTDLCRSQAANDLSLVRGICPDIPAMEGSYLLTGLAYDAWTNDLRPDLILSPPAGNPKKPPTYKNSVKTFAVALARNLPSFDIPTPQGTIDFAPLCQANSANGTADALGGANDANWRSCYMGSVTIGPKTSSVSPNYVYGRALASDKSAGSYTFVWEDSLWGNDHENDVVTMITYCVGSACTASTGSRKDLAGNNYAGYDICWRAYGTTGTSATTAGTSALGQTSSTKDPYGNVSPCPANGKPAVGANEVLVRIENLSAYAGNDMLTGYTITGAGASDGAKRLTLRPGNTNGTLLTQNANPPSTKWYAPIVLKYTASGGGAKLLQNPLFYAAKYGSFNDINSNGIPDAGEWDSKTAGTPDNFFAVNDPSKLKTQLKAVFDQVLTDAAPTASVATSSPRYVAGGTLAYQVSYNAKYWTGDIQAFNLNPDGTLGSMVWSANAKMPTATNRNVFTSQLTAGPSPSFQGTDFSVAGLNAASQTTLFGSLPTPTYNVADLIAYLRGDQSKEQGAIPAGPYRTRNSKIGDILNSTPAVVAKSTFAYARLPKTINGVYTGSDIYANYVSTKSATPTVFVGANDGMLHAVSGATDSSGGKELFAYIPNAILPDLNQLALPSYSHRYYVDGSPLVGDAFINGVWKTVLLSSTGAFGTSGNHHGAIFALDVTNPGGFGASNVMWEFNDQIDPTATILPSLNMGQAMVQPALGLSQSGKWIVAFGNGYNSVTNHAVLFIRDLATGSGVATIDTGVGSLLDPNGLSTATIVDTDGDGGADTIYAGDYQGNLWKFVYSGGTWKLDLGGLPLFSAVDPYGHRQPITSGVYTVANPFGGTMVLFGTGKYLSKPDADPTTLQSDGKPLISSVYSIWDKGDGSTRVVVTSATRSTVLQQQQIDAYSSTGYVSSTQAPFNFNTTGAPAGSKMGWFMDLALSKDASGNPITAGSSSDLLRSRRVIAAPTVILGTLLVNTFQAIGDLCVPGGLNSLLELDALTGAANYSQETPSGGTAPPTPPVGDATGGTDIGTGSPLGSPLPVVSIPPPPTVGQINCIPGTPGCTYTAPAAGSNDCKWTLPNPANKAIQTPIPCGRVSWRQLR